MIKRVVLWCLLPLPFFVFINSDIKKSGDLKLLPLIFRREDAEFFNKYLNSDDVVAAYAGHAELLRYISKPKRLLVAPSIERLQKALQKLEGIRIDYINYNPEIYISHNTPPEEIENLVETVMRIREICDGVGAKLSFTPDKWLLEKYAREIAPLVDMFGIQIQRYQRREDFEGITKRLLNFVKEANPEVKIIVQISMAPPLFKDDKLLRDKSGKKILKPISIEKILMQMESLREFVYGVAILYTEETSENLKNLIIYLRR